MHLDLSLGKRHLALFLGSIAALVALAATPQLLGDRVEAGIEGLTDASPLWIWLAGAAFAGSLVSSAAGWRSALTRCGGSTTGPDATARYCTGSLVNALAPARIGTAVRFALFARTLPNEGRLWTVGGVATSIGAVRALWLALVLTLGSLSGALPRWPIARCCSACWSRPLSPGARARRAPAASTPTRSTSSVSSAVVRAQLRRSSAGSGSRWRFASPRPPRSRLLSESTSRSSQRS